MLKPNILAGIIAGAGGAQVPVRSAAFNNFFDDFYNTSAADRVLAYKRLIVDSDKKTLVISDYNWKLDSNTGASIANLMEYTILSDVLVYNGVAYDVTENANKLISVGDTKINTSEIPASVFGVDFIPAGSTVMLKRICASPNTGGGNGFRFCNVYRPDPAIEQSYFYLNASATIGNIKGVGPFTASGAGANRTGFALTPVLLGRGVEEEDSWAIFGDSITAGTDGTTAYSGSAAYGRGYVTGALKSNDNTSFKALLDFSIASQGIPGPQTAQAIQYIHPYLEYCNKASVGEGTNDTPLRTVAANEALLTTFYNTLRSNGVDYIIGLGLMFNTTSTDSFLTTANQTPKAGWTNGANADQLTDWIMAQEGGLLNVSFDGASVIDPSNLGVWPANGVTNFWAVDSTGLHPKQLTMVPILADALRTALYP